MAQRLENLSNHLTSAGATQRLTEKHPDDVVITCALRTPFTKGGRGGFKDTEPADLLLGVLKAVLDKSHIDPAKIDDVGVGNVLSPGAGAAEYRAACFAAGIPDTSSTFAINRQCSSGLIACNFIANEIRSGQIDVGIGAGVESMSLQYGPNSRTPLSDKIKENKEAVDCEMPMGITSENVAEKFHITRKDQDAFAARSFQKAEKAWKEGLYNEEVIPLQVTYVDPKTEESKTITVDKDDGIRKGVTAENLGKLRPAFKPDGTTHAGNASQISDGAAAVLLMRRSVAEKLGQTIIGKFVDCAVAGVPPEIMGVGPAAAIPKVLAHNGISKDDVDIYEINEAFASQCLYCIRKLGLDVEKVNPKGGAIAIGHPLGCTGARQIATLLSELKRTNKKVGVTSMCIGTGMGAASIIVAE